MGNGDPRGSLNIRLRRQLMEEQQRNLIFDLLSENEALRAQLAERDERIKEKDKLMERLWNALSAAQARSAG